MEIDTKSISYMHLKWEENQTQTACAMPFMKGLAPIRRTYQYLQKGEVVFKNHIKILAIHYNTSKELLNHEGARQFVFWNLPQLQYKNPNVQIMTFKNLTPTPFIRCYLDNDEQIIFDVDDKSRTEIFQTLKKVVGKTENVLKIEELAVLKKDNPANFGDNFLRHCICEVPGQVPCSSVVKMPNEMRGKGEKIEAET
ncbi:putative 28S ribosomal protein S25, mitochondrial [Nymphon striatum]|nr:putative 28S ribosomal protein S25, mitochondrial [Nymphon striatum]